MLIDIPVIQDLAITASMGVAVLIFTSLLLMPVALSFVGSGARRRRRALRIDTRPPPARASAALCCWTAAPSASGPFGGGVGPQPAWG